MKIRKNIRKECSNHIKSDLGSNMNITCVITDPIHVLFELRAVNGMQRKKLLLLFQNIPKGALDTAEVLELRTHFLPHTFHAHLCINHNSVYPTVCASCNYENPRKGREMMKNDGAEHVSSSEEQI